MESKLCPFHFSSSSSLPSSLYHRLSRFYPASENPCQLGNNYLRLVNGSTAAEGRVEVCVGDEWGTIASDYTWDTRDARVICKQLGYSGEGNTSLVLTQSP